MLCKFISVKYLLVHRPINCLFKSVRFLSFAISELSISSFLIFIKPNKPNVVILGHSFVHRFKSFIHGGRDQRVKRNLNLSQSANLSFHGVGGRTIDKLRVYDLRILRRLKPDIVILDVGSNGLCLPEVRPETLGSRGTGPSPIPPLSCLLRCGVPSHQSYNLSQDGSSLQQQQHGHLKQGP